MPSVILARLVLYDWLPGYKAGTGIYNSFTSGSLEFTGWEALDLGASFVGAAGKGLELFGEAASAEVQLFRAVSADEAADISATGVFRAGPNSIEFGKWFALNAEDAGTWGQRFYGEGNFKLVQTAVSQSTFQSMEFNAALDGIGPAAFAELPQLANAAIRVH